MARFFYLYPRNGIYYAEILGKNGERLASRSTGKKNRDEAACIAGEWVKDGIPSRDGSKRSVAAVMTAASLVESVKATTLALEDAEKIVKNLLDRGLIVGTFAKPGPGSVLLSTFLEEFWDYERSPYFREKRAHGRELTRRHAKESANRIRGYWIPAFEGKHIHEITRADIKRLSMQIAEKGLAADSINKIITAGTTALAWAHREGLIPSAPTDGLTRFSGAPKERGFLSDEETALLFNLSWKDNKSRLGNLLACTTGMRSGEVLAVRRSDIGERFLTVSHSWSYADGLKCPKNGETRRVPVMPEVRDSLLALCAENPRNEADPFAFYSQIPGQPMDQKLLIKGLTRACDQIGVDHKGRGIVFHSWRHGWITRLNEKLNYRVLMQASGHKTRATFEHYADHALENDLLQIGIASDEIFTRILEFKKA